MFFTINHATMKVKYLYLCILAIVFASCQDSKTDSSGLELSESTFENVRSDGATLTVEITSSSSWTAASSAAWCTLTPNEGAGSQSVSISVGANLNTSERTATIAVTSSGIKKIITVTQQAAGNTSGEYQYKLPVIFHVFYEDKNNPLQYVSQNRLSEILNVVNKLYKDKTKSVDMNLTFTLATTDPNGKTLTSPGVEYTQWSESYPIDCDNFMSDNSGKYVKYIWDPNQYINVMIYNFTEDPQSNTTTLGISHLPFTTTGSNSLEGLNETQYSYLELKNLSFPYCTSINSKFIDHQSTSTEYDTSDVTVTLAHELGHYLGLHHTFSENNEGIYDGCTDSDYCDDTPTYNKVKYDADYTYIAKYDPTNFTFSYLVKRENCKTGQEFTSTNIMDYSISYSDRFTNDQRNRIRHVLTYSPLIPGPKQGQTGTRSVVDGPLDLPIRTIK